MSTIIYDDYHGNFVRSSIQRKLISDNNFTYVNFFRYILPIINEVKPKRILDIGSGAGTLSLSLANQGFRVVGVDTSVVAIEKSRISAEYLNLQTRVDFVNCDFLDFSSNEKFDLILCSEVIEHIFDVNEFLKKIRALLINNGIVVLSTPLDSAPLAKLGLAKTFDNQVGHLRRYGKVNCVSLLESNRFHVKKIIETEGIIRNSLFVFPILGYIIRFIRGPLVKVLTLIDDITGRLLGFSDLIVIATKK